MSKVGSKVQQDVVVRKGGTVARTPAEATHLVLEEERDPATLPALAGLPVAQWPRLVTARWVSNCSQASTPYVYIAISIYLSNTTLVYILQPLTCF